MSKQIQILRIDQSRCSKCGVCVQLCRLLQEDADGSVSCVGGGLIKADMMASVNEAIDNCPDEALSIVDDSISLEAITAKMKQKPAFLTVKPNIGRFNKADYSLPIMSGRGEYNYRYSSDYKAEREGLSDFRNNIWSQKENIAKQVVILYKQTVLMNVLQYEAKPGNYKFDIISKAKDLLKKYVGELEAYYGKKIDLPARFYEFETRDTKILKDIFRYEMDEGWAHRIANECEPADWFDSWIDSDYTTKSKRVSHWFGDDDYEYEDVYCYKLSGASKKLNDQILDEAQRLIPEMMGQGVNFELETFSKELEKEWNAKINQLLKSQ